MKSFVDEGRTIRIYYDLEGQRRKDLVKALGEILLWEPKYLGAPDFSYQVGNYLVTKIGAIICPESCTREIAEQIILKLKERGFDHTGSNLMLFVVSLPRAMFDNASLERLHNLVKSKETILKAALGARALQIETTDEKVYFPWFTLSGADGEADAYTKLIAALGKAAREQKRISSHETPQAIFAYQLADRPNVVVDTTKVFQFQHNVKQTKRKQHPWEQWSGKNLSTAVHRLNPLTAHNSRRCLNMSEKTPIVWIT